MKPQTDHHHMQENIIVEWSVADKNALILIGCDTAHDQPRVFAVVRW